jgi:Uri superfamily endonuclease
LKGIYVLIVQLSQDVEIRVGALGTLHFAKGFYVYVGSAQNNLEKRIERHLQRQKRRFWHVDYLLENPSSRIMTVLFKEAPKTSECAIAETIGKRGEAVVGFGCSDCHCKSHLFRVDDYDFLKELKLHAVMSNSSPVS